MPKECFTCKKAGYPNQSIVFAGKNGDSWIMKNPDGSEHQHKVKQEQPKPESLTPEQQRQLDIHKAHLENMEANRALVAAINRLAAVIEAKSRL